MHDLAMSPKYVKLRMRSYAYTATTSSMVKFAFIVVLEALFEIANSVTWLRTAWERYKTTPRRTAVSFVFPMVTVDGLARKNCKTFDDCGLRGGS